MITEKTNFNKTNCVSCVKYLSTSDPPENWHLNVWSFWQFFQMAIFGRVRSTYRRNGGAPTCCTVIPANSKFTVSCFYFAFAEFNEFIDLLPNKGQVSKSISDNGKEKFCNFCNLRICSVFRIYVYHVL